MRKVHKNAAGADVGSKEIFIATPKGEVKSFTQTALLLLIIKKYL